MPYKRKRIGRSSSYSRRRYGRTYRTKRSSTRRTLVVNNARTGGFVGVETKYYDTVYNSTTLGTTLAAGINDPSTPLCLCAPIQGTGPTNRDGRMIFMKGITVYYDLEWQNASSTTNGVIFPSVMLAVILDTQTNQANITTAANVFDDGGLTNCITVPKRNMEFTARFKVLCRKLINPPPIGYSATDTAQARPGLHKSGTMYCNLQGLRVTFNGNAGTCADIADNSLHMFAAANSSGTNKNVALTYHARVTFHSKYVHFTTTNSHLHS